jgi:hypothetical protein
VAVGLGATPAHALVQPPMNISITANATFHKVCGSGTASATLFAAGQWVLAIHGSRSDGSAINQVVTVGGPVINNTNGCMNVLKFGAAQGEYQASLTYVGAGTDVIGEKASYGAWQPGLPGLATDIVLTVL